MKNLISAFALFLIVFSFQIKASSIFQVEGTLIVQDLANLPFEMTIKSDEGEMLLSNVHTAYGLGCTYGTYLVSENLENNKHQLLQVVECLDDALSEGPGEDLQVCPGADELFCEISQDKTFGIHREK